MRNRRLAAITSLLLLLVQGCGVSPFPAASGAAASGGNDTVTQIPLTAGTLFAVHVLIAPEADPTNFTLVKSCEVADGTAIGTALACVATIPEGTLHFSRVKLQMVVPDGISCGFAVFHPYYYRASNTTAFLPEWTDVPVDCDGSVTPLPVECFSGPAVTVVPDFPKIRYIYITPVAGAILETAWTFESANQSLRYSSNRWTNNTLAVRNGNLTSPDGNDAYIASSMVDYSFECRDDWYDINYQIDLTIQDENTGGAACVVDDPDCNQWPNWNSTQSSEPQ